MSKLTTKDLMERFAKQHEEAMKAHESVLEKAQEQYEAALLASQKQLEEMLVSVEAEPEVQENPTQTETNDDNVPAAVWITAPDGEQMMMLNQSAAVMFMAIFDRMAEIANSLSKK